MRRRPPPIQTRMPCKPAEARHFCSRQSLHGSHSTTKMCHWDCRTCIQPEVKDTKPITDGKKAQKNKKNATRNNNNISGASNNNSDRRDSGVPLKDNSSMNSSTVLRRKVCPLSNQVILRNNNSSLKTGITVHNNNSKLNTGIMSHDNNNNSVVLRNNHGNFGVIPRNNNNRELQRKNALKRNDSHQSCNAVTLDNNNQDNQSHGLKVLHNSEKLNGNNSKSPNNNRNSNNTKRNRCCVEYPLFGPDQVTSSEAKECLHPGYDCGKSCDCALGIVVDNDAIRSRYNHVIFILF